MAATADPRAKPPPAAPSHHLMKPWAPQPPRAHRVPSRPEVAEGGGARDRRRSASSHRRVGAAAAEEEPPACEARLEDLRAKLMGHLRDAAGRLRLPPARKPQPRSPEPEPERRPPAAPLPPPEQQEGAAPAATAARPWNLRDRKCRRQTARGAAAALDASPAWEPAAEKARADGDARAPFAVALTAEEVEEDVYALTGTRPRRRPRKRPRVVQRQLDTLFPGLWLTEITADAYKVPDE
ncbi:translation initiation factor IF-2-like [Panicum virgatum]|uniref:DUF1639 family protein n=1 Tax=Panicum virgatum TaxID=38727 RepID=A0A8T0SUJ4_PANVG|nr:translation initiation factor IF-2-like [Panicum virgatum]KAG2599896.1 hypothetical protein PVAP13_5KG488700 [Panicum virgatum]